MNPIKPTLKTEITPILMLIISFIASFYFYGRFPSRVPSHWNFAGQVDGYSSAEFGAFGFPAITLGIYLLLLFIPYLDPKKDRYQEFKNVYHIIKISLVVFMTIVYFLASLNGLGYNAPIGVFVPIMIGILFIILGNYMSKLRLNWFVGMRNPWTLSSEEVWNKTNRLTGKIFIIGGIAMILESFIPNMLKLPFFIATIVLLVATPNIYSFIIYKKLQK
jgi:uncharacterized membrane protein